MSVACITCAVKRPVTGQCIFVVPDGFSGVFEVWEMRDGTGQSIPPDKDIKIVVPISGRVKVPSDRLFADLSRGVTRELAAQFSDGREIPFINLVNPQPIAVSWWGGTNPDAGPVKTLSRIRIGQGKVLKEEMSTIGGAKPSEPALENR